jgi:hypothetical protein
MADISISYADIEGGNINFSRDSQYFGVMTYGAKKKIETTLSLGAELATNLTLEPNWDDATEATWSESNVADDAARYNNTYSRYSTDFDDFYWSSLESEGGFSPRGYREFDGSLVQLSGDPVEESAVSWVEETGSGNYIRSREEGFTVSIDNSANVPSVKWSGNFNTIDAAKDKIKYITLSLRGMTRLFADVDILDETEVAFSPFTVETTDRYVFEDAIDSYRDSPGAATPTTETGNNDGTNIVLNTVNKTSKYSELSNTGSIILRGDYSVSVGDKITTITGAGFTKTINALVVSKNYLFETDQTAIQIGRP